MARMFKEERDLQLQQQSELKKYESKKEIPNENILAKGLSEDKILSFRYQQQDLLGISPNEQKSWLSKSAVSGVPTTMTQHLPSSQERTMRSGKPLLPTKSTSPALIKDHTLDNHAHTATERLSARDKLSLLKQMVVAKNNGHIGVSITRNHYPTRTSFGQVEIQPHTYAP